MHSQASFKSNSVSQSAVKLPGMARSQTRLDDTTLIVGHDGRRTSLERDSMKSNDLRQSKNSQHSNEIDILK